MRGGSEKRNVFKCDDVVKAAVSSATVIKSAHQDVVSVEKEIKTSRRFIINSKKLLS